MPNSSRSYIFATSILVFELYSLHDSQSSKNAKMV
nr:MAG TPA: hypothetical protein [Caudoviricetes sp.]